MNAYFLIGSLVCLLSIGWSQNWIGLPFSQWAGVGVALGIVIIAYGYRKQDDSN